VQSSSLSLALRAEETRKQGMARGLTALVLAAALVLGQAMQLEARGAPESFADLADTISPAVVNITTSTTVAAAAETGPQVPEGSPFEEFFRDFMDRNGRGESRPRRSEALGSGFVISEDGYIVTNNHVIDKADEIEIEFFSGKRLEAKLIGTDPKTDIALLKVESDEPLPFVPFGNSDLMRVGDWVIAMGNPLGQGFSVSAGIISARGRALSGTYDDYLQTDAAINRGNSGGPLFNMDGQVIGVNTAILSPTGGSIGIGFSMASNVVTEAMGLATTNGALITDVPDGPAKDAGMMAGDVIISFDGEDVSDTRELVRRVGEAPVGEAVRVIVMRDGATQTLSVVLGRRETAEGEASPAAEATPPEPTTAEVLGLTVSPLSSEDAETLGMPAGSEGLAITGVDEVSEAYAKGLRTGDVITEVGQQKVTSISDLQARIKEAEEAGRKSLLLLIRRAGDPRFVALSIEK
jgi:serine protease Do